jgi:hypothetical protein
MGAALRIVHLDRFRAGALILLLFITLTAVGHRCFSLGSDWYLAARYWFYAFPSYFSEVTYGAPRYTYFRELAQHFGSANPFETASQLQPLLDAARLHQVQVSSITPRYFPADEKGTVDFVRLAFRLFGTHVHSVLYTYLALLWASALVFVVRFRREPKALVVGVLAALALYVGVDSFPVTKEVYSVTNPRAVGSLSLFALTHLMVLIVTRAGIGRRDVPALFFQSALILLVIMMRTAELWQVIALIVLSVAAAARSSPRRAAGPALAVVAPLVAMVAAYQLYQGLAYPAEYSTRNLENKIFWHNVLIGFAIHPVLAQVYGLDLSDTSVLKLVTARALNERRPDFADVFWTGTEPVEGMVKNYRAYDALCRDAIWTIAKERPWQVAELFSWYKPRLLLRSFEYASGRVAHGLDYYGIVDQTGSLTTADERRTMGAYFNPLSPVALTGVGVALFAAGASVLRHAFNRSMLAALGVIAAASLLPAMLTYPLIHVIAAAYITVPLLLYACGARAAAALIDVWRTAIFIRT